MKRLPLFSRLLPPVALLMVAVVGMGWIPADAAKTAGKPDLCTLYGSVYVEKSLAYATYKVYVERNDAMADLVVFKESAENFADKPGHWFLTSGPAGAKFSIALVSSPAFADFTVAYTSSPINVRCE